MEGLARNTRLTRLLSTGLRPRNSDCFAAAMWKSDSPSTLCLLRLDRAFRGASQGAKLLQRSCRMGNEGGLMPQRCIGTSKYRPVEAAHCFQDIELAFAE